jgi:hypothetical protein
MQDIGANLQDKGFIGTEQAMTETAAKVTHGKKLPPEKYEF